MPLAIEAALGKDVNCTDFDARDGTAVRDYVNVSDLAEAHVLAAEKLLGERGVNVYNLGTGVGAMVGVLVAARGQAEQELSWTRKQETDRGTRKGRA